MMVMIVNNDFCLFTNRNEVTIRTMMYPDVNPPSPEISNEEIFQAKGDLMKSIQTFLERFNCIPFEEKPQILFQTWEIFFAIQCSQPEDSNELFQKLLKDLKELAEYDQSTSTDRPIFLNDNEDHHVQNREQEVKIVEEQPAECRNRIEKSLQNFRVIHKSSISLNTSQISSIHEVAPILSTKEPKKSLSMGYEHLSITPEMKSAEVTESNAKNLLPIPSECEVTSKDKRECDELVCDNHSDTFSDFKIDDDISVYDDDFEDIEYVEASLLDPEIVSIEEENDNFSPEFETFCDHSKETRSGKTTHANYSLPEYDSFCFEIEPDKERLINLVKNDNSDSSNNPLLEEADLFLFYDSIPPGIENVADDPEGDIRFLEELLINDSILSHKSFDSSFEENPLIPRPPPEPPDDNFDLEPEVILAVMEDNDEHDEYFNPGGEIFVSTNNEDVDYFPFMFVIRIFLPYLILPEISPLFLSAESEDTIFDPGLSPEIEVILCWIYVQFPRSSYPLIDFSLGRSISF
nr:hypothetical protein [Tanacetum cinerariifolium]